MTTTKLLEDKQVLIMGILNTTPDSFSDGGSYNTVEKAVAHAEEMIQHGADSIDIGGESTRPGATQVSLEEELKRTISVIKAIRKQHRDISLSIDTYKAEVARQALDSGATIVNDISGLQFDSDMASVVAAHNCAVVINHIQGTPENMQQNPHYEDVETEISDYFKQRIAYAHEQGIKDNQIILDPGFGFGKRIKDNIILVNALPEFVKLGYPLMIGVSRKGSLGKILKEELRLENDPPPTDRLEAALAFTSIALTSGVSIIRTHDVAETNKFIKTFNRVKIN